MAIHAQQIGEHQAAHAGRVALSVAGFDPSSGAGITADLAVFAAHRIFGISAITALTIQSTRGVRAMEPVHPKTLEATLEELEADLPPDGVKIGMLGGVEQVAVVVEYLRRVRRRTSPPVIVLDPVLRSSSGAELLSEAGVKLLRGDLLPLTDVITPNTMELEVLTGMPVTTEEDLLRAAESLRSGLPALSVLVTGGHRDRPDDVLVRTEGHDLLPGEWIRTRSTHGTGCAFSSALLCQLLRGADTLQAATAAKRYVEQAMRSAVPRGSGKGPMNLLWPLGL
jgi:hydroxymethylpyrimidine/phosphomethylpyrimidine kinase